MATPQNIMVASRMVRLDLSDELMVGSFGKMPLSLGVESQVTCGG